jgi:hypothetical protein
VHIAITNFEDVNVPREAESGAFRTDVREKEIRPGEQVESAGRGRGYRVGAGGSLTQVTTAPVAAGSGGIGAS